MKRSTKGFTLVELIIVIAVVGVLAAILIPTFANVIDKANFASDVTLAKNMNTALKSEFEAAPQSFGDALTVLNQNGYNFATINTKTPNHAFGWDSVNNQIIIVNQEELGISTKALSPVAQKAIVFASTPVENAADCFLMADTAEAVDKYAKAAFNVYVSKDLDNVVLNGNFASVDTGDYKIANLTITSNVEGTIKLNGMFDRVEISNPNGTVIQNGVVGELIVDEISRSGGIQVNGYAKTFRPGVGRTVVSNSAVVEVMDISNVLSNLDGQTIIENMGQVESFTNDSTSMTKPQVEAEMGDSYIEDVVEAINRTVLIATKTDLVNFRNQVNAGRSYAGFTVQLTSDVNITGVEWTPIGTETNSFNGTFEGYNHKIVGLTSVEDQLVFGLFLKLDGATVKNLTLSKVNASAKSGGALTAAAENSTFENVAMTDSIVYTESSDSGALIGWTEDSTFNGIRLKNVKYFANYSGVGAVVGYVEGGSVENIVMEGCTVALTGPDKVYYGSAAMFGTLQSLTAKNLKIDGLKLTVTGIDYAGCISGYAADVQLSDVEVKNANINTIAYTAAVMGGQGGTVTVNNVKLISTEIRATGGSIAGIIGYSSGAFILTDVEFVSGLVLSTSGSCCGGLVGQQYITTATEDCIFTNCINRAKVTAGLHIGGVAGYIGVGGQTNTQYINCKNYGEVGSLGAYWTNPDTGKTSLCTGAGGIAGSSWKTTFTGCENHGKVYSNDLAGGVVGTANSGVHFTNCKNTAEVEGKVAGAIIGDNSSGGSKLTGCENSGNITADNKASGMIAGFGNGATFTDCVNTGDITATAASGIAGDLICTDSGTVTNSTNSGTITGATRYLKATQI